MISIIIPTFNEERNIAALINSISKVLTGCRWRIIHVDDGSTDRTAQIVSDLCTQMPITIVRHDQNRGIAETFRDGFSTALADAGNDDVVVLMEGDLTNDPAVLPKMIERNLAGADVVIASRYRRGAAQPGFPLKRKILSFVLNRVILPLWVPINGVRDYSIFYRSYRVGTLRKAVQHFGPDLMTCSGFGANAELLCKIAHLGATFSEVPQVYNYALCEGNSAIPIQRTIREYIALLRAVPR